MSIQRFYAVTVKGSVYRVDATSPTGFPTVRKVNASVLGGFEEPIGFGNVVTVDSARQLVSAYRADGNPRDRFFATGVTTPLVGLFLTEAEALGCLRATDRKVCDVRWKNETLGTIAAIGQDHPAFYVPEHHSLVYGTVSGAKTVVPTLFVVMALGALLQLNTGCASNNASVRKSFDPELMEACTPGMSVPTCDEQAADDNCVKASDRLHRARTAYNNRDYPEAFRQAGRIISGGPKTPYYSEAVSIIVRLNRKVSDAAINECMRIIAPNAQ